MLNMNSIILIWGLGCFLVVASAVFRVLDQRQVPINIILVVTILTLFLVSCVRTQNIQKFFIKKLSQKITNAKEKCYAFKTSILKMKQNRVGLQNMAQIIIQTAAIFHFTFDLLLNVCSKKCNKQLQYSSKNIYFIKQR